MSFKKINQMIKIFSHKLCLKRKIKLRVNKYLVNNLLKIHVLRRKKQNNH